MGLSSGMKVFRGRLVHSIDPHSEIAVLEDHVIGIGPEKVIDPFALLEGVLQ